MPRNKIKQGKSKQKNSSATTSETENADSKGDTNNDLSTSQKKHKRSGKENAKPTSEELSTASRKTPLISKKISEKMKDLPDDQQKTLFKKFNELEELKRNNDALCDIWKELELEKIEREYEEEIDFAKSSYTKRLKNLRRSLLADWSQKRREIEIEEMDCDDINMLAKFENNQPIRKSRRRPNESTNDKKQPGKHMPCPPINFRLTDKEIEEDILAMSQKFGAHSLTPGSKICPFKQAENGQMPYSKSSMHADDIKLIAELLLSMPSSSKKQL